jgi:hypothetical protein
VINGGWLFRHCAGRIRAALEQQGMLIGVFDLHYAHARSRIIASQTTVFPVIYE